jgi:hypothetical protein
MDISTINPAFIDADFPVFPQYVPGDIQPDDMAEVCRDMAVYEENFADIPRNEWEDQIKATEAANAGLENVIVEVKNQSSEGSCVGNATTQGCQIVDAKQSGKDDAVRLSAISLYQKIGRSPSSGAMVSDALKVMRDYGALPLDTPANRAKYGDAVMPATGFYSKRPANAAEVAKKFRIDEFYVIRTYEGIISAGLRGDPVIVGRSGHSICYVRPTIKDGKIYYMYVNSWGAGWGMPAGGFKSGFGLDSAKLIQASAGWAFAIRSVVVNQ